MPITDFTNIVFSVEYGYLVMHATARSTGTPYRHACPLASYEAVVQALAEAGPGGITRVGLHEATGLPWTRIQVALLFLYERSIVERAGPRERLYVPTTATVYEDAMVEYHALREGPAAADEPQRCPKCGIGLTDHVHDPDGRRVCGECGHAWDEPESGS